MKKRFIKGESWFIQHNNIGLVIVDIFREFIGHKENDSGDYSIFFNGIKSIIQKDNVSFLFIHHQGKMNEENAFNPKMYQSRGSSQIVGAMRSMILLKYLKDNNFSVEHTKSNISQKEKLFQIIANWSLEDTSLKLEYSDEVINEKKKESIVGLCDKEIINYSLTNKEFEKKDLLSYLSTKFGTKFKSSTITKSLKNLVDSKFLTNSKFGGYKATN